MLSLVFVWFVLSLILGWMLFVCAVWSSDETYNNKREVMFKFRIWDYDNQEFFFWGYVGDNSGSGGSSGSGDEVSGRSKGEFVMCPDRLKVDVWDDAGKRKARGKRKNGASGSGGRNVRREKPVRKTVINQQCTGLVCVNGDEIYEGDFIFLKGFGDILVRLVEGGFEDWQHLLFADDEKYKGHSRNSKIDGGRDRRKKDSVTMKNDLARIERTNGRSHYNRGDKEDSIVVGRTVSNVKSLSDLCDWGSSMRMGVSKNGNGEVNTEDNREVIRSEHGSGRFIDKSSEESSEENTGDNGLHFARSTDLWLVGNEDLMSINKSNLISVSGNIIEGINRK